MKKVVILHHNKGQLCNQLWNFVSIYAYCLEKGYDCQNYSFFEYSKYFNIPVKDRSIDFLFFKPYAIYSRFLPFRVARKIGYVFYDCFVALMRFFKKEQIVYSGNSFKEVKDFYYLPPTKNSQGKLSILEKDNNTKTIYFDGWLFRNPQGLLKYRKQIISYFRPKEVYCQKVDKSIEELRKKYNHLVGVHIRQKAPGDGEELIVDGTKMYISNSEIPLIKRTLDDYIEKFKKDLSQTCFIVCSNKEFDISQLRDFDVIFHQGNLVEDLYTLSKTDAIVGCRSTFGSFAAFYGNIPHFLICEDGKLKENVIIKSI